MIYTPQMRGKMGELAAARALRDEGYEIVDANFRTKLGEIDIIAYKDGVVAFCEVKTRENDVHGRPVEYVTYSKRRKLVITAIQFMKAYKIKNKMRFDVIEVHIPRNKDYKSAEIHHIVSAFTGDETPFNFIQGRSKL